MRIERAYMYGPGVKYSGADGTLNTILNKHVLYRRKEQLELGKSLSYTRRDKSLADEIFLRKYDSLYSLLHEIDDEFISKNPSPYSKLIKNERMSAYYGDLCVRYWGQSHKNISEALFDDIKSHKAYLISNDGACFYDYLVNLISAKSGKYDPVDFSNFTEYSQLDKSQKMEILKYTKIKELKKSGMSYDTIQFETLGKSIFKNLSDTLVISRTIKTINYIDSLFDNSKADFLKMKLFKKIVSDVIKL